MKKNIIYKGAFALVAAASLASCASDYLDREPITLIDETQMLSTVDNAQRAVFGACRSMNAAYQVGGTIQFMNGEAWINTMYNEVFASDAYYALWQSYGADFMNGSYLRVSNFWMPQMPWMYCYNIINQVNKVLDSIDTAEGPDKDRAFVKAQALTLRAHGYIKLVQLYGPRWEDANGGDVDVAPLRLTAGTGDHEIATMGQIIDQIYKDLDDAIALYKESGYHRSYGWEPDVEIAQGLYARIAMIKHDWAKARDMAAAARADYPIMSGEQYLDGFNTANQEWLWYNDNISEDPELGTYCWGALYACNGGYVSHWGFGAGAINYDLFRKMDKNDIRRQLYFTPESDLPPFIRRNSFWNTTYIDDSNMNLNKVNNGTPTQLAIALRSYSAQHIPSAGISYFVNLPYRDNDDPSSDLVGIVPFGAQFKFWGSGPFSNTSVPYMRGAELAFLEAEAAYMLGDENHAREILVEVNGKRVEGYSTTATGEALLDEIRTSKRIELWGEGFCWTDLKRWNMHMIRRPWVRGDVNSNNIPPLFQCDVNPSDINGWRVIIPNAEADYNDLIEKFQQ